MLVFWFLELYKQRRNPQVPKKTKTRDNEKEGHRFVSLASLFFCFLVFLMVFVVSILGCGELGGAGLAKNYVFLGTNLDT